MADRAAPLVVRFFRTTLAVAATVLIVFSFAWVIGRPVLRHEAAAGRTLLTVLHWGDRNEDAIVAGLIREFEAQNPDIRVVRTNVGSPAQLVTKLQTMLSADTPPDAFYLIFEKVAPLASQDLLADIEPFMRRDAERGAPDALKTDDFFPGVINAFRYDKQTGRVGAGTLVGLGKDFTTVGFYYNKDLFRRAGVPLPSAAGWTWDEFLAAARAIGKLPGCHGAEFVTWESMIRIYLRTYGVDVTTPGFAEPRFDDPAVRAALAKLSAWFEEPGRTLLSAKTQLETGQEPFLSGTIGLAGPYGRWKVPTYRHITDFEWDFAPLPHAPGQPPANGVLTAAWAMARRSRHPEEAWRFIKFMCGPRGQRKICEQGLAIPALRSVAYDPCFTDAAKPDNDGVFLAAAEIAQPIEWPADQDYMDQMKKSMERIFKTGARLEPELDGLQRTWIANRTPTIFRARYERMPWSWIALGIGAPLALLVAAGAVRWWVRRPGRLAQREERAGLALVSPWVIGFAVFMAFPIVLSLLLAFTRWSGLAPLYEAEWVGLDNFRELIGYDATFRQALRITILYALLAVPSSQLVALLGALLMNREFPGVGVFRAIWYLPSVLAGVGMAILWKWVFHHEHGLLNSILDPLLHGLHVALASVGVAFDARPPAWLERDAGTWGVPAFAILNLWVVGGTMMIYLAGLKGISRELYEAAEIDGATGPRRFLAVTLPMLSPVIFFNVIMALIASFQIFTQVFVMTGGGPGTDTTFYVYYIYSKAFDLYDMGYASAMAWLLMLLVLALTLLILRGSRGLVYYEALRT